MSSLPRDIPVSLGKPSLRRRLEAYYSLIAPDQIADTAAWLQKFDQIWTKFGGSYETETKLAAKLAKKYGSTAVKLLTAASVVVPKGQSNTAEAVENATSINNNNKSIRRDEEWYQLTDQERGSRVVDFTSSRFDPLTALTGSQQAVVTANPGLLQQCRLMDRVDQCRSILPPTDPLYRPAVTSSRKRSRASADQAVGDSSDSKKPPATAGNKPKPPSCFASLAEPYEKGPLSVLYTCLMQRQRVRVVIRYVNGIRGTVTGYLVAFDKHLNMILRDADEVYSPRRVDTAHADTAAAADAKETTTADAIPVSNLEAEVQRRVSGLRGPAANQQWTVRQRHLAQILIRGDNVVLVYKAEAERSAWPVTPKSPAASMYRQATTAKVPPNDQRVGTPGSLIYAVQRRPAAGRRSDYTS